MKIENCSVSHKMLGDRKITLFLVKYRYSPAEIENVLVFFSKGVALLDDLTG